MQNNLEKTMVQHRGKLYHLDTCQLDRIQAHLIYFQKIIASHYFYFCNRNCFYEVEIVFEVCTFAEYFFLGDKTVYDPESK